MNLTGCSPSNKVDSLLTPQDAARHLKISVRTVYQNANRLGGFYPFGLRVLRFRKEVICGNLEGPGYPNLEMEIPVPAQAIWRGRIPNQARSLRREGGKAQGGNTGPTPGENAKRRFLEPGRRGLSGICRKTVCSYGSSLKVGT